INSFRRPQPRLEACRVWQDVDWPRAGPIPPRGLCADLAVRVCGHEAGWARSRHVIAAEMACARSASRDDRRTRRNLGGNHTRAHPERLRALQSSPNGRRSQWAARLLAIATKWL